ncbi:glycosyltransferase [Bosea sp. UNC402CLCol]|uniref:glycosyltransferase family protein n=1 Tax=Bosea sp. UNC402CLCol TaxID=1510531 RepID=UPI00056DC881|nr:glycosyltransferase [Bosea sp. UNC402CLCol]
MSGTVLIVVTHLLGSGHLVRAAHLARALARGGFAVTLASGGMTLRSMEAEPFAFVQLPPVRTEGVDFRSLLDEAGQPVEVGRMAARIAMVEELAARLRPDVVITEHFPFGRRQLAEEFLAAIAAAKAANPAALVLASVRDVLVTPKPTRIAEAHERIAGLFDAVLVHGEADFLPLERSWPVEAGLRTKLRYTGYLADRPKPAPSILRNAISGEMAPQDEGLEGRGEIVVSGGGSAAAVPLFELALAAARLGPAVRRWRILVGRSVAEEAFRQLAASAPDNAIVERARPDFPTLLARCAVSISQAGYNTVLDLIAARRPAIVVPFDAGAETEQAVRAEALERAGLALCLRLSGAEPLTAEGLARAVETQIGRSVPAGGFRADDGGRAVAAVKRLLRERR